MVPPVVAGAPKRITGAAAPAVGIVGPSAAAKQKAGDASLKKVSKFNPQRYYEELRDLGSGAFGAAVLVRRRKDSKRFVAKKCCVKDLSEKQRAMCMEEIQLLKKVRHEYVAEVVDFRWASEDGMNYWVVLKFYAGGDVQNEIDRCREEGMVFEEGKIRNWTSQLCMALDHVHSLNIVHRDVKGSNLFVTGPGNIVLGDFGVSKQLDTAACKAMTQVGSPVFMAPESWDGRGGTGASDMWAVGVVLYEMVALKRPFEAGNVLSLVHKITTEEPEPLPEDCDDDLRKLATHLLHKCADNRPTASEALLYPCLKGAVDLLNIYRTKLEILEDKRITKNAVLEDAERGVEPDVDASFTDVEDLCIPGQMNLVAIARRMSKKQQTSIMEDEQEEGDDVDDEGEDVEDEEDGEDEDEDEDSEEEEVDDGSEEEEDVIDGDESEADGSCSQSATEQSQLQEKDALDECKGTCELAESWAGGVAMSEHALTAQLSGNSTSCRRTTEQTVAAPEDVAAKKSTLSFSSWCRQLEAPTSTETQWKELLGNVSDGVDDSDAPASSSSAHVFQTGLEETSCLTVPTTTASPAVTLADQSVADRKTTVALKDQVQVEITMMASDDVIPPAPTQASASMPEAACVVSSGVVSALVAPERAAESTLKVDSFDAAVTLDPTQDSNVIGSADVQETTMKLPEQEQTLRPGVKFIKAEARIGLPPRARSISKASSARSDEELECTFNLSSSSSALCYSATLGTLGRASQSGAACSPAAVFAALEHEDTEFRTAHLDQECTFELSSSSSALCYTETLVGTRRSHGAEDAFDAGATIKLPAAGTCSGDAGTDTMMSDGYPRRLSKEGSRGAELKALLEAAATDVTLLGPGGDADSAPATRPVSAVTSNSRPGSAGVASSVLGEKFNTGEANVLLRQLQAVSDEKTVITEATNAAPTHTANDTTLPLAHFEVAEATLAAVTLAEQGTKCASSSSGNDAVKAVVGKTDRVNSANGDITIFAAADVVASEANVCTKKSAEGIPKATDVTLSGTLLDFVNMPGQCEAAVTAATDAAPTATLGNTLGGLLDQLGMETDPAIAAKIVQPSSTVCSHDDGLSAFSESWGNVQALDTQVIDEEECVLLEAIGARSAKKRIIVAEEASTEQEEQSKDPQDDASSAEGESGDDESDDDDGDEDEVDDAEEDADDAEEDVLVDEEEAADEDEDDDDEDGGDAEEEEDEGIEEKEPEVQPQLSARSVAEEVFPSAMCGQEEVDCTISRGDGETKYFQQSGNYTRAVSSTARGSSPERRTTFSDLPAGARVACVLSPPRSGATSAPPGPQREASSNGFSPEPSSFSVQPRGAPAAWSRGAWSLLDGRRENSTLLAFESLRPTGTAVEWRRKGNASRERRRVGALAALAAATSVPVGSSGYKSGSDGYRSGNLTSASRWK